MAEQKTLTVEEEIAQRLNALEMLKNIFISQFRTDKIEEWPGNQGPMFNLFFRNPNAISPIQKFTNKEGVVVEIKTIGDLAGAVVENLRGSGYWIVFNLKKPDGRGGVIPIDVTMWSYAKGGFIVCKGREAFSSVIDGTVTKSTPKAPKVVDDTGKEIAMKDVNLDLGMFSSAGKTTELKIT